MSGSTLPDGGVAPEGAAGADVGDRPRLGDHLIRTMKMLQALKAHAPRAHPEVDPLGYPLLFQLVTEPRRLSDVAAQTHCDLSTASRQVTHLVSLGLIAKGPDPQDRRAQLLSLTPAGEDVLHTLRSQRDAWLARLLADWEPQERADFTHYLARFADALSATLDDLSTKDPR